MIIKQADYISDDPTPKVGGGVALTLKAERRGCIITYQTVAGTLNPGGHPGSYNGQDAYNDMLVTENELLHRKRTSESGSVGQSRSVELYARSAGDSAKWGG